MNGPRSAMKIVIDDKIPFIKGVFEPFATVVYLPGAAIGPDDVRDADALVVRTRTKCDRQLLERSAVRFIATATIGFDHIDAGYCAGAGIKWTNAPGCNSGAVKQYIASALFSLAATKRLTLEGKTLGIVGVGAVGSKIAQLGEALGMRVLKNDPPRARNEGDEQFTSLHETLKNSDFLTLHVPLNRTGPDQTYHLINRDTLKLMKKNACILNSSRGEVIETSALTRALQEKSIAGAALDVWENEPGISRELLQLTDLATPHIAGYSQDGKANGSSMSVRAIARFFQLPLTDWYPENLTPPVEPFIEIKTSHVDAALSQAVAATYRIEEDDQRLRKKPDEFENLRGNYPARREFQAYKVAKTPFPEINEKLAELGFVLTETRETSR